jgi:adenylate kinase family enzyme
MSTFNGKRIVVIGTSGAGKTTLARRLAAKTGLPHVEVDSLNWGPNWTEATTGQLQARVEQAIADDSWVLDGNYSRVRAYVWARATTLIWLDYSLPVIMTRLIKRTARRVVLREELWSGNRENFKRTFTKDSILWWALTTYKRRRREYPVLLSRPENAHLQIIHFKSPRAAERWLAQLETHVLDKV